MVAAEVMRSNQTVDIVKLEPTAFAEGLGVGYERYINKDFGLSN